MTYSQDSPQRFHWHYAEFDETNFQIHGRTLFCVVVLFSLILFLALLFLYARWLCRFGPPAPPVTSTSAAPPPLRRGLDAAAIDNLPTVLLKNLSGDSEAECCICLGVFGDGDRVKVLPKCRHCFHFECVDKWLTARSSCPLCRSSLRVDSLV